MTSSSKLQQKASLSATRASVEKVSLRSGELRTFDLSTSSRSNIFFSTFLITFLFSSSKQQFLLVDATFTKRHQCKLSHWCFCKCIYHLPTISTIFLTSSHSFKTYLGIKKRNIFYTLIKTHELSGVVSYSLRLSEKNYSKLTRPLSTYNKLQGIDTVLEKGLGAKPLSLISANPIQQLMKRTGNKERKSKTALLDKKQYHRPPN